MPSENGRSDQTRIFDTLRRGKHRGLVLLACLIFVSGVAILPLIGQQTERKRPEGAERDSGAQIRRRADWFFHQRAYPLGHIPAGARIRAFQQAAQMRQQRGFLMDRFAARMARIPGASIPANQTTWTPLGPQPTASSFFGNTSGRVNALAVDPCDTTGNTLYAGGAQGGLWKTITGGASWSPMTDQQLSLASGSIALDPTCSGTHTAHIYYGTGEENFAFDSFYGEGVLISSDGGNTWTKDNTFVQTTASTPPTITPQNGTFAGPFIGALSVSPASGSTLLAAVQSVQRISGSISAIWSSTDAGMDWTPIPATSFSMGNNQPLPSSFDFGTSVQFDPNDKTGNTAFAALGIPFTSGQGFEQDNGVYRSTDAGQHWTRLTSLDNAVTSAGLSTANYGRITMAVGPATQSGNPATSEIIASIADITKSSSDLLGAFISVNGGQTFTQLKNAPAFCNDQCFYDMAIGISPANPQIIFLGGGPAALGRDSNGNPLNAACGNVGANSGGFGISAVIRSTDGGNTWTDASCDNSSGTFIHVDTHAFAFDAALSGGTFFIGNDGGIWSGNAASSGASAQNWTNLNSTLNLTQFYPGNSINPSNPEIGFSGSQDNGTQMFSGSLNWTDTEVCGDGSWTAIDPSTPSTVYAACEAIGLPGTVNKNQVDGTPGPNASNWIALDTPAMDKDSANFVPPIALDNTAPQNVYFGTNRVWQSTNGGISWTPNSLPFVNPSANVTCGNGVCVTTSLSVAPNDSNTVYVGSDVGEIFASTNASSQSPTFTKISQSNMPGRIVTQVVASPTVSSIAFATFSGFSSCANKCDGLGHIFETLNGGGAWTNITGNLPDTPVNDIVVDPNDTTNSTLYIATDVGVFATTTGGASWSELASGLPHVEDLSLKLDENARILRVGTHGRGEWDLQLPGLAASALTGLSPTSVAAGTASITLTLTGQGLPTNPTVNFGSTPLTASGGGNTLSVTVPGSALSGIQVVPVSVQGSQNSLNFSIEGLLPTLTQNPSPNTIKTGNDVTLTVTGTNFNSNSGVVWRPTGSGTQNGVSTLLKQNSGGSSTTFTVTVPASLLSQSLTQMAPVGVKNPGAPSNKLPRGLWFLAAAFAAVIAILRLLGIPRRRRLAFGSAFAVVAMLLVIAGCGSGGSSTPPPPPPGGKTVQVNVQVLNAAPGGGLSNIKTVTVSQ